mgnify:CR=1 FL=1
MEFLDRFRIPHENGKLPAAFCRKEWFCRILVDFLQFMKESGVALTSLKTALSAVIAFHKTALLLFSSKSAREVAWDFWRFAVKDLPKNVDKPELTYDQLLVISDDLWIGPLTTKKAAMRWAFALAVIPVVRPGNSLSDTRKGLTSAFDWRRVRTIQMLVNGVYRKVLSIDLIREKKGKIREILYLIEDSWDALLEVHRDVLRNSPEDFLREYKVPVGLLMYFAYVMYHWAWRAKPEQLPSDHKLISFHMVKRGQRVRVPMTVYDLRIEIQAISKERLCFFEVNKKKVDLRILRSSAMRALALMVPKDTLRFMIGHLSDKTLNKFYNGLSKEHKVLVSSQLAMDHERANENVRFMKRFFQSSANSVTYELVRGVRFGEAVLEHVLTKIYMIRTGW